MILIDDDVSDQELSSMSKNNVNNEIMKDEGVFPIEIWKSDNSTL